MALAQRFGAFSSAAEAIRREVRCHFRLKDYYCCHCQPKDYYCCHCQPKDYCRYYCRYYFRYYFRYWRRSLAMLWAVERTSHLR